MGKIAEHKHMMRRYYRMDYLCAKMNRPLYYKDYAQNHFNSIRLQVSKIMDTL